MKPVYQTIVEAGNGNCMAACLASILELEIEDMPNYHGLHWFQAWQEFLLGHGYQLVIMEIIEGVAPKGYHLISGKSVRGDWNHVVVGRDGVLVHDPNPDTNGLEKQVWWEVLVPAITI